MPNALVPKSRSPDSQFADDALFLLDTVALQTFGIAFPEATKARLRKGIAMPQNFILELSAVAYVGHWERSDLKQYLAKELPTYQEASEALRCRVLTAPERFFEIETFEEGGLFARTSEAYFLSYSHSTELGCQFLVGQIDNDDALVEALLPLLWKHRHSLKRNEQQLQ